MKENIGVLLPVSSLPSKYGIGDFGKNAYKFVDWLVSKNYKYWQVLPLNPLGPGDSPYMSPCSEALETRYIDFEELIELGYLKKVPSFMPDVDHIKFWEVERFKEEHLYKAFLKFIPLKKSF